MAKSADPAATSHRSLLRDLAETSLAQGATVLLNASSLAVIGRRLGETDLGLYTLERRSMALLQPLILLGLSVATPRYIASSLGRGDRDHATYAHSGASLVAGLALVVSIAIFFLPGPTATLFFGDASQVGLARALAGFALATALYQITYSVFRGYVRVTSANLLELAVVGAIPLALAMMGPTDIVTLMWWMNAAIVAVTCVSAFSAFARAGRGHRLRQWARARGRAGELLRFGLSRTPGDLAVVGLFSIPPVAVVHFATAVEAGYTSVVVSAMNLVSVLAVPLGVLVLPRVALAVGSAAGIPREQYRLLAQATLDLSLCLAALLVVAAPLLLAALLPRMPGSVVTALQIGAIGMPGYIFYVVFRSYLDAVDPRPVSSYATVLGVVCLGIALGPLLALDLVSGPVGASIALAVALITTGAVIGRALRRHLRLVIQLHTLAPLAATCAAICCGGVVIRDASLGVVAGAGVVSAFVLAIVLCASGRPWVSTLVKLIRARAWRGESAAV